MLSLIGAVLIIGSTTFFGISAFLRLKRRVDMLDTFLFALGQMEREITQRLLPIPEVLELLIEETKAPVSHFFARVDKGMREVGVYSFSSIWNKALGASQELLLKKEEVRILEDVGKVLGRYHTQEQKTALQYAQKRIAQCLKQAQAEKQTQGKMQATLGVAAGIFVVLILL